MDVATMFKGNKRLKDESFEAYKSRRCTENLLLKWYLRGRVFWQSKSIYKHNIIEGTRALIKEGKGTYIKKFYSELN